jgi:hypothetical protein
MNIQERAAEILKHYETAISHAVDAEKVAIEAALHAELAKVESMMLGLVAQFKAKLTK